MTAEFVRHLADRIARTLAVGLMVAGERGLDFTEVFALFDCPEATCSLVMQALEEAARGGAIVWRGTGGQSQFFVAVRRPLLWPSFDGEAR